MPEDPVKVAPDVYKLVLENEQVRVLEVRLRPGAKTERHGHPAVVAVMLQGGRARFTEPGGEVTEIDMPNGQAMYLPETEHMTENAGDGEVHGFLIELKK